MLELSVKNFQSIQQSKINIDKFTVILGKSDMGKSAIRRAIQTALFNDWDKNYIRHNTKKAEIEFKSDTTHIHAVKSSTENSFTINGVLHPKMGKDKPQLPNFRQDLNISTQLEPLFMVAYKDTENTKILNDLFGINMIETAQYMAQQDLRKTKQENNFIQEQIKEKQELLKQTTQDTLPLIELTSLYDEVEHLQTILQQYITTKTQYNQINQQYTSLKDIHSNIKTQYTTLNNTLLLQQYINNINNKATLDNRHRQQSQKNEIIIDRISTLNHTLLLQQYINNKTQITALKEPTLSLSKFKGFKTLYRYLTTTQQYNQINQQYKCLQQELESVNKEIQSNSSNICPYCKQEMPELV